MIAGAQKCISVAFTGLPNAGKSSLMNRLVGEKISIVTPKAQTTRDVIRGVVVEGNTQLIVIDTPGIFVPDGARPRERRIGRNAWGGVQDTAVVCIIIDSDSGITKNVKVLIDDLAKKQKKIIFVLNKVDIVKKEKLLLLSKELSELYPNFIKIFMVSATKGDNIDRLKEYLLSIAEVSPWVFNDDEITDAPSKFIASEITREKLFLKLKENLPYSVDVHTEQWEEFKNGSVKIRQVIRALKNSQKAIILGKRGFGLKEISMESRAEMEKFFGKKIHLFIFVQVKEDWISEKFSQEIC
ncbi:MAG: GTPase Era [Rickettsiales bacterium]|jgi:GTP-binding protein Era|nr:GTPase Era [Rickettsiales bacterium]